MTAVTLVVVGTAAVAMRHANCCCCCGLRFILRRLCCRLECDKVAAITGTVPRTGLWPWWWIVPPVADTLAAGREGEEWGKERGRARRGRCWGSVTGSAAVRSVIGCWDACCSTCCKSWALTADRPTTPATHKPSVHQPSQAKTRQMHDEWMNNGHKHLSHITRQFINTEWQLANEDTEELLKTSGWVRQITSSLKHLKDSTSESTHFFCCTSFCNQYFQRLILQLCLLLSAFNHVSRICWRFAFLSIFYLFLFFSSLSTKSLFSKCRFVFCCFLVHSTNWKSCNCIGIH